MQYQEIIACHDCDLLQTLPVLKLGETALCIRCRAKLYKLKRNTLNKSLALTFTAIVLFAIANLYPFLSLNSQGQIIETTLISGSMALYHSGNILLSTMVLLTTILFPLINLAGMLYILLPLKVGKTPWNMCKLFRFLKSADPWGMLEVLLLGVIVASVKLGDLAVVIPGIALYSFSILIVVLAALDSALDPQLIFRHSKAK